MRVLPLSVGAHTGTEGTFTLLSAPPELETTLVCVTSKTASREQITTYRTTPLTRLRVLAINPTESPAYIHQLMKDL
ncbi:DUF5753 domain-containing protein [Actinokineospora diospyrosa]|uniref:DUF5753 domain-containing protein n=1 Tax=Actinokineospora diospyrosa TaxID=103728 RepID=UPI0020A33793|nr:DUF5753 domain-containing protein [Actinokineospora diospyrosa]